MTEMQKALGVLVYMVELGNMGEHQFVEGMREWVRYRGENPNTTLTEGQLIRLGTPHLRGLKDPVF